MKIFLYLYFVFIQKFRTLFPRPDPVVPETPSPRQFEDWSRVQRGEAETVSPWRTVFLAAVNQQSVKMSSSDRS